MGSADSEIVGEDVVSETVRCALLATGLRLEDIESDNMSEKCNQSDVAGWVFIVLFLAFHDCQK